MGCVGSLTHRGSTHQHTGPKGSITSDPVPATGQPQTFYDNALTCTTGLAAQHLVGSFNVMTDW